MGISTPCWLKINFHASFVKGGDGVSSFIIRDENGKILDAWACKEWIRDAFGAKTTTMNLALMVGKDGHNLTL